MVPPTALEKFFGICFPVQEQMLYWSWQRNSNSGKLITESKRLNKSLSHLSLGNTMCFFNLLNVQHFKQMFSVHRWTIKMKAPQQKQLRFNLMLVSWKGRRCINWGSWNKFRESNCCIQNVFDNIHIISKNLQSNVNGSSKLSKNFERFVQWSWIMCH